MQNEHQYICKNCGNAGTGNYCSLCGEKYRAEKITLGSLIHQVFHLFTHFDKGFAFTVKQLAKHPGQMQREYIDGIRSKHQKPFAFFFVCGTLCGLAFYFINVTNRKLNGNVDIVEEDFFRHYFVIMQACMLPFYALLLWLIFIRAKYNYAEMLVLMLYNLGFVFLIFIPVNVLKIIFIHFDTRYIEVVFLLFYNTKTNLKFFIQQKKWLIILNTIILIAFSYTISQIMNEVAKRILH